MRYRKKPAITEATQWFRNGDHPEDHTKDVKTASGATVLSEGQVVKFFRRQHVPGGRFCPECGHPMQKHGILHGLGGEEVMCPGDYVVTDKRGRFYRMPAVDFEAQYEPYGESAAHPPPLRDRKVFNPVSGERNAEESGVQNNPQTGGHHDEDEPERTASGHPGSDKGD